MDATPGTTRRLVDGNS